MAETFDCDPLVVTEAHGVVAHASCMSDNNFLDAIGTEFERTPPDTLVVSLEAGVTQETLVLSLIPFYPLASRTIDLERMGVIAAVLLVTSRSSALGRLRYEPLERANVGRRRCCFFLAGFFESDKAKSFTNFEAAGWKFALLSFVHFDWDGHGANYVMVADRKRTLDPKVFVSKRHCGNHVTGLCEACMHSAVNERTHWSALQLENVLADFRPFPSACASDG